MTRLATGTPAVLLLTALLGGGEATAQTIQLAPFAGYQFGGSFVQQATGLKFSLDSSLDYGGTVDVAISKNWRFEALYSRQESKLQGGGGGALFDLNVERLMGGIVEEKGEGRTRWFGVFLAGATRYSPRLAGFDTDTRFTLGVDLGLKSFFSDHFGMRAEVRGFYTFTETNGGVFCGNGTCLFLFGGSGVWQGDVSGGLILAF